VKNLCGRFAGLLSSEIKTVFSTPILGSSKMSSTLLFVLNIDLVHQFENRAPPGLAPAIRALAMQDRARLPGAAIGIPPMCRRATRPRAGQGTTRGPARKVFLGPGIMVKGAVPLGTRIRPRPGAAPWLNASSS